jgi:predicted enzyme related to lactoylglutathione lyase
MREGLLAEAATGMRGRFVHTLRREDPMISGMDTVVQFVSDLDGAARFYGEILDMEIADSNPEFGFVTVLPGGMHPGIMLMRGTPETGRGGSQLVFHVASVQDAFERLAPIGVRFHGEPVDLPPGKYVSFEDPDGNLLALIDDTNLPPEDEEEFEPVEEPLVEA